MPRPGSINQITRWGPKTAKQMEKFGFRNPEADLRILGISGTRNTHWNLSPEDLIQASICRGMGVQADSGALVIKTGKFTGRAPKDRFIVEDSFSQKHVDWGRINQPISAIHFYQLRQKMSDYLLDKDLYVRDVLAGADPEYQLEVRVLTEYPWSNQFAYNMFLRPSEAQLKSFAPAWSVLCVPGFKADPAIDGTRSENFAIINFEEQQIIIGGTGYTGEIKKGIFSVLNAILPIKRGVLPMHCSANVGQDNDVAVFFGLSGTGKTTLSADADRALIGDDEHGWSEQGIFNFEGGCYAKTIDLSSEKEPEIFGAIKHRAILENVTFFPDTKTIDFSDSSITENTRVSYPINHIANALPVSKAEHPRHIFFLTADAFGVLPPLSKLTPLQAMYYFISGYTAKVAGTEEGVLDPEATFSACFGAPFLPLAPVQYAEMLKEKMEQHQTQIWLVNTGWTGGGFGVGKRISLRYTRAMINAVLKGDLDQVDYQKHEVFGLQMPQTCAGVPDAVLNPKSTWQDPSAYDEQANRLAGAFTQNFKQYELSGYPEILAVAPRVLQA